MAESGIAGFPGGTSVELSHKRQGAELYYGIDSPAWLVHWRSADANVRPHAMTECECAFWCALPCIVQFLRNNNNTAEVVRVRALTSEMRKGCSVDADEYFFGAYTYVKPDVPYGIWSVEFGARWSNEPTLSFLPLFGSKA